MNKPKQDLNEIKQIQQSQTTLQTAVEIQTFISDLGDEETILFVKSEGWALIIKGLGNCISEQEQQFLYLLENIAYRGTIDQPKKAQNLFYYGASARGMIGKIENIIQQKIKNEQKKSGQFEQNNIIIELVYVYCMLMKNKEMESKIIKIVSKVINWNINQMVKLLQIQCEINDNANEQQSDLKTLINNNNNNNYMQNWIKILKGLCFIAEDYHNRDQFHDKDKMEQNMIQLLHINCPKEIQCPTLISIQNTESVEEIRGCVLSYFGSLCDQNTILGQKMIDDHQIIQYINPIIINFASLIEKDSKQSQSQTQPTQMQSISLSSSFQIQTFRICDVNVLIGSLELLRHLPFESTPFVEKLFLFPQFGNSLMNLMRFERNKGNKQKIQQMIDEHLSLRIRHLSLQTLSSIQWAGGPNVQNQLILQNGYVNELIQCIGNGGGSFESNKRIIINSLESLRSIFTLLSDGESWCPSQKQLIKSCEEIIEPESGIEEIETHLFHIDQSVGKWVRLNGLWTKMILLQKW